MIKLLSIFTPLLFLLVACDPKIDPIKQGEMLFNQKHLGKNKTIGCVLCHSIKPGETIVGPSLASLSLRAPHIVSGQSAKEYIRESIINPDAHIVDGYLPAVMPSQYQQDLSKSDINSLVDYLSQL